MTAVAFFVLAAPAFAAQRWVAPTAQGSGDCSSQANACTIATGISNAAANDEVIVTPGAYNTGTTLTNAHGNLNVHGLDGAARPTISSSAPNAIYLPGSGDTLRYLSVIDSSTNGISVNMGPSMTVENVIADVTNSGGAFISNGDGALVRDSVAVSTVGSSRSGGTAIIASSGSLTLRNVTAYATGPDSVGLLAYTRGDPSGGCTPSGSASLTAENVIAHGEQTDAGIAVIGCDPGPGQNGSVTLDYSNYSTTLGTITDGGHNQRSAAQTNPNAIFVDPGAATPDLHELLHAPTVDAGIANQLGPSDADGNPRTVGSAPDIGAYELVPPPTITVTAPSTGAVYGPGQVVDASYSCTPAPGTALTFCSGPAASGAPIDTTPGTHTFTVTAQANNSAVASRSVTYTVPSPTTVPGPSILPSGPLPPGAPVVAGASESHTHWREGHALPKMASKSKVPVGTIFAFDLSEAAQVKFAFTQRASGRKVKHHCVVPSRKNKSKPKCTRTVIAGALSFAGHAGRNSVTFDGRLSKTKKLKPGRYSLLITATSAGQHSKTQTLTFTIVK